MSQFKSNFNAIICFMFLSFIMLSSVSLAEAVSYTYDDANRLIREEDGSGTIVDYIYDDGGHLLQKNLYTGEKFLLTVSKTGTGSGTVVSSETPTPSINCGTSCSALFNPATVVRLNVTPDTGNSFSGWSGDCSGTANPLDVQMNKVKTCTATFAINTYTVTPSAGANGSISPNTPQTVDYNSTTAFTVNPNTGYSIASVNGCGGNLSGNIYTTGPITANCTVTATFIVNQFTLTVNKTGTGSGTVSGGGTYYYGSTPNITALAATGSTFTGWGGDADCSDGQVTMNADKTCTATFTLNQYTLTVNKAGTGSGTVGGGGTYDYATTHDITATASTGSTFKGWSGNADCSDGQVTMNADKTCTATFTLNTYTVTATATNGTATPATQTINYGATATVTGAANANYYFTGVSGCNGTTQSNTNQSVTTFNYTTGTITGTCPVTATYAIKTYTVTPSAGANGTITPNTPQTVNYNSTTSFTVNPTGLYSTASVSGCGGSLSGNTYTTGPITANCTVTATFNCNVSFTDVTPGSSAEYYIKEMYCRGITTGCLQNPLMYCPANDVTRQAMAVFIIKAMGQTTSGAANNAYFDDIAGNTFAPFINRMKELGITTGCGTRLYCPGNPVTRQAMAVFIIKAMGQTTSGAANNAYFDDIAGNTFAPYINRMYELGITTGCGTRLYCPNSNVTRSAMAIFIIKAF